MKPNPKFIIVFNIVCNLPIAFAIAVVASLMNGGINLGTILYGSIGFLIACAIGAIINVQKMNAGFAGIFKLKPESVPGRLVGNIAACLVYTAIILAVMLIIIIGFVFPDICFAFLGMFPPLFVTAYIVSTIFTPLAIKLATAASSTKQTIKN